MNKKVTYSDIVNALSAKTGFSKQKSEAFVKALLNQVKEELQESGKASITNFGSFKVKNVAERQGKNPQTGDPIVIPAHKRVSFSPYKSLRENVNARYGHLESKLIGEEAEKNETDTPEQVQETESTKTADSEVPAEEQTESVFAISSEIDEKGAVSEEFIDGDEEEKFDDEPENEIETNVTEGDEVEIRSDDTETDDDFAIDEGEENKENLEPEPQAEITDTDTSQKDERSYTNLLSLLTVLLLTIIAITTVWFLVENGSGDKKQAANESQANVQAGTMVQNSEAGNIPSTRTYEAIKSEADELEKRINALTLQAERLRAQLKDGIVKEEADELNTRSSEETAGEESMVQTKDTMTEESEFKRYEVKQGDWYWAISKKLYGKPRFWPLLFMENHTVNEDPDSLLKLTSITVPDMEGTADNPTRKDYKDLAAATKMVAEAYERAGKPDKANEYAKFAQMWEKMGV